MLRSYKRWLAFLRLFSAQSGYNFENPPQNTCRNATAECLNCFENFNIYTHVICQCVFHIGLHTGIYVRMHACAYMLVSIGAHASLHADPGKKRKRERERDLPVYRDISTPAYIDT